MGQHRCFACDANNPLRIASGAAETGKFRFAQRLVGPRGRAHGGAAVGALTCPALRLAEEQGLAQPVALHVAGRLNLPVPLGEPMDSHARREQDCRYRVELHNGTSAFLTGSVLVADQPATPGAVLQSPPLEKVADLQELARTADADLSGPVQIDFPEGWNP